MNFFDNFVEYAPLFLEASLLTLRLTAVALVIAMVLGAVIAWMAMSRVWPLRWLATAYIGVIRGTPLIAQIFLLYFGIAQVIRLDMFWAGAIALALHNSAYIAEIFRSGFQAVPRGLVEASRSLGMSKRKTLRRVQAPLALRTTLPVLGNQYIIAVKDSSLVAFIGMGELFKTSQNLAARNYEPLQMYLMVSIYYLVIVLILTFVVNRIERSLSKHRRPVDSTATGSDGNSEGGLRLRLRVRNQTSEGKG
ncbi:amino acid ABC transporter permease [Ornithinimicrobium faecis]|uniref:Amino acid ABC transporter permease n=1 Tax=Ornithinimicrobium faecis TaxID=2934158 RepID=A0ABY4YWZ7_9MICO|nr:amino acid ABC transporter permease [Ornithinimicrobium sp. HY1793]USQ80970.1 amino acid ABC transporter permease [Ornithinimicrobium sp. HY1793]